MEKYMLGMVVHAYNLSTLEDHCELEASLNYTVSSKPD